MTYEHDCCYSSDDEDDNMDPELKHELKKRVRKYFEKKVFQGPQMNFKKAEKGYKVHKSQQDLKRRERREQRRILEEKKIEREKQRELKEAQGIEVDDSESESESETESQSEIDMEKIALLDDQEFLTQFYEPWMERYERIIGEDLFEEPIEEEKD